MTKTTLIALAWLTCLVPVRSAPRPGATAAQAPAVAEIVARAADYVAAFTDAFSNVVAEEHYTQDVSGGMLGVRPRNSHRELRSDIVLLKIGGPLEWRPYRDVFDVDGTPVRDRDDRLVALFQRPSPSSFEQAARIARESARFNIGLTGRTINTPVLSLLFLQQSLQPRFRFKLGKLDAKIGAGVWTVEFREQARPTLVRGLTTGESTDLPAQGRFWIEAATGRVVKADAQFTVVGMSASLITTYRHDEALGMDVPFDMHEVYRIRRSVENVGSVAREQGAPRAVQIVAETVVSGVATYSHFRKFSVTTDAEIAPVGR